MLISIGIITIGLLGTLAMFPVGAHKVGKANQYDRTASIGQAAFHDIITRRLLRPDADAWVQPNGDEAFAGDVLLGASDVRKDALRGAPFAIDPLWCSYTGETVAADNHPNLPFAGFPYINAVAPALSLSRRTFADATSNPPGAPVGLRASIADLAFRSRDDIILDLPDDRDLPSQQSFKRVDPLDSTSAPLHRNYTGDFSWMFTAVPQSTSPTEDLYTVSVVVFYKRQLDINPQKPPERMVQVDSNENGTPGDVIGGFGGIEANLYADPVTLGVSPGVARTYLEDIRAGEWVMLSTFDNRPATPRNIFKWFRVVSAEDDIQGSGPYTRWVSLVGSDWDPGYPNPVYISLFEGAIAVFEKTMQVEGSSLYVVE